MALTDLAETKIYIGIPALDTTQDAVIELIRPAMEELVIGYCDTDFAEVTLVNEVLDGFESDVIVPQNFPVTSIDEVRMNVDANGTGGEVIPVTDYIVDNGTVILRQRSTPYQRGIVALDYKYGYVTVPATVKLCVWQAVKAELQRRKRNNEDISSRSKGDESESYGGAWDKKTGLPVSVMAKLNQYRVIEFPQAGMPPRHR